MIGDFNGDGIPDLALMVIHVCSSTNCGTSGKAWINSLQTLFGNGDGTFTAGPSLPVSQGTNEDIVYSYITAKGDFNGDGIEDLVVASSNSTHNNTQYQIFFGSKDGSFRAGPPAFSQFINEPTLTVVGDFNGDGIPDLAVSTTASVTAAMLVTILLGNGDGTFTQKAQISTPGYNPCTIIFYCGFVAADFEGSGNLDLAVVSGIGSWTLSESPAASVILFHGNGDGTFTQMPTQITFPTIPNYYYFENLGDLALGDFNGDGKADLIATFEIYSGSQCTSNCAADLALIEFGNGDGTFTPSVNMWNVTVQQFGEIYVEDFNGDGLSDVASFPTDGAVYVMLSGLGPQSATATVNGVSVVGTGPHQVDASYSGNSEYRPSVSATIPLTAEPIPTTLALAASPPTSYYTYPTLLTATLTPNPNTPSLWQDHVPGGSVNFSYGTSALGTDSVANEVATFSTGGLPVGTDNVSATYSGDSNFATSTSNTISETVSGYNSTTILHVSPNPAYYGQSVTLTAMVSEVGSLYSQLPTGTVTFYNGTTQLTTVALDATGHATYSSVLPFGIYSLTAAYSGDAAYYASSSSPATSETVNGYHSTTSLAVAPNPAGVGHAVTMSVAVAEIGNLYATLPAGSVTIYDGTSPLATVTLDSTAHATYTTSTLTLGAHPLTAVYAGNAAYYPSTSPIVNEVLVTPDFAVALSSPSITLQTYQHTTTTVTLASIGEFADSITLSCVTPPTYVTCIFTPEPTALTSDGSATVSFYLDTDSDLGGRNGPASARDHPPTLPFNLALLLSPASFFVTLAARRRRSCRRSNSLPLLLVILSLPTLLALTSCGGNVITPIPSTAPGTYTIPITATGATGLTHTAQLSLIVTQ